MTVGLGAGLEWSRVFFIDRGRLFLRVMEALWERGREEAAGITNALRKHGVEGGVLLDLMCGIGRVSIPLAEMGYRVLGVDFSPIYIEYARRKASELGARAEFMECDVRRIATALKGMVFDAVVWNWTSIGYYSRETDISILKQALELTREGGLLVLSNTASRDILVERITPRHFEEFDSIVVLHWVSFDPISGRLRDTWRFYEKRGLDLKYLGEADVDLRVYTATEVIEMLEEAGWSFEAAYSSLSDLTPYELKAPLNIVARKQRL